MAEEIDKKYNPDIREAGTENIDSFEASQKRETEGLVVESLENEPIPDTSSADVKFATEEGSGEDANQESSPSEKPFNPELAYTTAVQEARNNTLQSHVVENVDYTKNDGTAHDILNELIGGDTQEKI